MTLKFEKGNLITLLEDGEIDILIHQCNCFSTMYRKTSSGLARVLQNYPEVCAADGTYKTGDINQLGKYLLIPIITKSGKKAYICNVYSQYTMGLQNGTTPTSYLAMKVALKNAINDIKARVGTDVKIGTYLLGTGLGAADANIVQPIIEDTLGKIFKSIRIVTLE